MEFDYVIVGGGSAGCVMAARLSEDPGITVCLLEAGGEGRDLVIRAPLGIATMISGRPKVNNWALQTVPQKNLNNRRGFQPRGKALGGSSAINAMLYVRGHPSDYDDWAAAGAEGWSWDDVLPWFRACEHNSRGADDLHGVGGPLAVSDQQTPREISHAFVDAAAETQLRRTTDFNGAEQEGAGLFQVTQYSGNERNGERCSAAAAYLHPVMDRPNLHVITRAQAERVVFEENRAAGVTYRKGGQKTVRARREVILSAGAFGSPHLLQLSGIGPGARLAEHGIEVLHDSPEVGANLQDHLDFILCYKSDRPVGLGIGLAGITQLIRDSLQWRRDGTSMIASPGSEAGAFLRTDPALNRPDVQLHFVPSIIDDHARKLHLGYGFSCHACVLRPKSRGTVRLASSDPRKAPAIDPNYLDAPEDLEVLMKGVSAMRRIMDAPPLRTYSSREIYTEGVADEDLVEHIRARADTIYHPVGTVRMGGPDAPADPEGRIRGVEGLRVVDASLMPTLIGGNTNAPTIMMAEKIATGMRA
ncbi:GMC family oxidoreductase [Pontivivens ytuae]|uniref:GMC family oxidoreductase N-terminal domain-containing protein n=1 Tax=Pontivivens ytuae TaxID=2789856 RepID=A0A7S9LQD6_9RHOB|nr:GMC family oxidoreductase N-terminal domain-containing protein [Pontivivens ytuae]QPH52815.1 GMC family oxidoreductase N-terminal domain-containing protein [Pontivivens ytuae]